MSTGFEFDVADDFEGSSTFLEQPGTYHCIIEDVKVGVGPKGNAYEGMTIHMSVLAGTNPNEAKKTFNHLIGYPKQTDSDGGVFRRKVMSKFLLAANQINPADKGKKAALDSDRLVGQQIVVAMAWKKGTDGKERLEVDNGGLAVHHVDDPHVANVPKDQAALQLIPAVLRHDAKWFEAVYVKAKPTAPAPVAPHTEASRVDLSQL